MKRIPLAVNAKALLFPLTGIGRYTRQLMEQIGREGAFEPRYFYGAWWDARLYFRPPMDADRLRGWIKKLLPGHYRLARLFEQQRFTAGTRGKGMALYHEPNFIPYETDLPTVITVHDLSHLRFPETHPRDRVKMLNKRLPRAIETASRILADSEFTRREILDVFRPSPEKVIATPLAASGIFHPRTESETQPCLTPLDLKHGKYILAVGTLEPRKNLITALRAYRRLPSALRRQIPMVIVGKTGWGMEKFQDEFNALLASGQVRWLGHVPEESLPMLYAGAALLAYPSLYEGFGLPPLEAMASGVPVVAADRASIPEVVGDAGILVEPLDERALADAMGSLLEDAVYARALGSRGLERAAGYSWEACAARTLQAYHQALGAR